MGQLLIMAVLAGLANLIGGWFTVVAGLTKSQADEVVALGTGFLIGGAFFTMLPAAFASPGRAPLYVAVGYLGLFLLRRLTAHETECGVGPTVQSAGAAFGGFAIHSFFDGAALGVALHMDREVGLVAFLAIWLHKIPEGFSLSALVLSATSSRRLALLAAGAVGVASILGTMVTAMWTRAVAFSPGVLVGIAAGSFLYVGSSDMLPAIRGKGRLVWLVLAGAIMVYLLTGAGRGGHTH